MPLQRPFRGFSDLVGLYEAGQLKLDLLRQLTPTVDAIKFASQPLWETDNDSVAPAGAGVFHQIGSTAENEVRIVWHMGYSTDAPVPAGNTIYLVPRLSLEGGNRQLGMDAYRGPTFSSVAAGQYGNEGVYFPGGFWLFPEDQLGWFVQTKTGGNTVPFQSAYQYSKFLF